MSDHGHEPEATNPGEFFADLAARLVERDLLAGDLWRPAATFGSVLDSLVDLTENEEMPEAVQVWASELLVEIVNNLLYFHVHFIPGQKDIDAQAADFASLLDKTEEIRKNNHKPNEED